MLCYQLNKTIKLSDQQRKYNSPKIDYCFKCLSMNYDKTWHITWIWTNSQAYKRWELSGMKLPPPHWWKNVQLHHLYWQTLRIIGMRITKTDNNVEVLSCLSYMFWQSHWACHETENRACTPGLLEYKAWLKHEKKK